MNVIDSITRAVAASKAATAGDIDKAHEIMLNNN